MSKRGRMISRLALCSVLLLLLAACGGGADEPGGAEPAADGTDAAGAEDTGTAADAGTGDAAAGGEVSLWTEFTAGGESTGMEQLIETFQSQSGGTINHRAIGNEEFFTVVRTGLAGGQPPDVLQWEGYQQTRDFAAAGQLTDITEFWNEHGDAFTLQDAGERACTYEGRVYCVPYTFHTGWQIYYNPELLDEHGIEVPTTYDEFLAAGDTLKEAGIAPISLGSSDGWPGMHWWMAFLVQRCGVATVYDAIEQNGAQFTDPCFIEAANDLVELNEGGYFSAGAASDDYGASQAIFRSGQAAFFHTGSWFAAGLADDPPDFEVGIMPFPEFVDNEHPGNIIGAVTHTFGVPSDAANPDGAMAFLDFLVTEEAGNIWATNGLMSMIEGTVEQSAPPEITDMWDSVHEAEASLPWIENELPPGVGEDRVYNGIVALLSDSMTPEEFGASIQEGLEAS